MEAALSDVIVIDLSRVLAGPYCTMILGDLGAETFEAFDMEIDGSLTDGAAAGERDAGVSATRNQRAEDQRRRAHGFD